MVAPIELFAAAQYQCLIDKSRSSICIFFCGRTIVFLYEMNKYSFIFSFYCLSCCQLVCTDRCTADILFAAVTWFGQITRQQSFLQLACTNKTMGPIFTIGAAHLFSIDNCFIIRLDTLLSMQNVDFHFLYKSCILIFDLNYLAIR